MRSKLVQSIPQPYFAENVNQAFVLEHRPQGKLQKIQVAHPTSPISLQRSKKCCFFTSSTASYKNRCIVF